MSQHGTVQQWPVSRNAVKRCIYTQVKASQLELVGFSPATGGCGLVPLVERGCIFALCWSFLLCYKAGRATISDTSLQDCLSL